MRKPDEIQFYAALRTLHADPKYGGPPGAPYGPMADEIAEGLGLPPSRAYSILIKWSNQGWWEYGVSARSGWFTEEAPEELTP